MLLNEMVILYASLFEISTKEVRGFIDSFVNIVKSKYPGAEIISLEREEESVIFVLENKIKVKFSPSETSPIVLVPPGYSAREVVYNFQLCTHLSNNQHLFTEKNIALLKKLECKNKTPEETTELRIRIADVFKIPKSERSKLWSLVSGILPLITRIKEIEKRKIVIGSKVVLKGDSRDFREVTGIAPKFYLKLKGINEGVDPLKVKVL